jgi:nitrite reductase/ring-hydroxylating ferredoxin subunit
MADADNNVFPLADRSTRSVNLGGRSLLLVRRGDERQLYENRCPHTGESLDPMGGSVLDDSGELLVCQRHGAQFLASSGECLSGPCLGEQLTPVPCTIVGDAVYLD